MTRWRGAGEREEERSLERGKDGGEDHGKKGGSQGYDKSSGVFRWSSETSLQLYEELFQGIGGIDNGARQQVVVA